MFKKLLIANRGEIAVRIARACRELGVSPVAVYSDVDRTALHVRASDEAVHIGRAPSTESYLVIEKIIDAALKTGAEAIHPGYGFLSENADFADAVERAGLQLIGPSSSAMRIMGSKPSARCAAQAAGAPIVPGTTSPLGSLKEAQEVAESIGYPVMLKAAAGGGGKGMRLVQGRDEIASALSLAQQEAGSSFGDPAVYVEKYIERPRHIEIQLIGDLEGNLVYLGERECSLQRRHQKLMEECPSPTVDEALRTRMGAAAVGIARTAGYYNAGTIEFLLDQERNFYFLEMNTRLQVEHPVTEMVVGRDLVQEQIRVAAGERLSFSQDEVLMRGAAIECRIYAEDPHNNFLPSPGRISKLATPSGPGVRDDSGVYAGCEVPVNYDSLLAKLCVWAETREAAIARLVRALDEYTIEGVHTTLPFFRAVAINGEFRAARLDTEFLDRFWNVPDEASANPFRETEPELAGIAAIAAVLHTRATGSRTEGAALEPGASQWKMSGRLTQRKWRPTR